MSQREKPILYSFWKSSCSWRVRIALNLKQIPHEIKPIGLSGGNHSDEFRKINPMEQVPALRIDGITLVQSLNIMQYLEETRPQPALLPQDVVKRARVREICEIIVSGIQPLQNECLIFEIPGGAEKQIEFAQRWISKGFKAVEQLLLQCADNYCVGNEITLADCCLVPQVYNARKFSVDLGPYPTILRVDKELENHPAFRESHPSGQPDCPSDATPKVGR